MDSKLNIIKVAVRTVRTLDREIESISNSAKTEEAGIANATMLVIRMNMLGNERIEAERTVKRNIQHTNYGAMVKNALTPESWARILG